MIRGPGWRTKEGFFGGGVIKGAAEMWFPEIRG